MTAYAYFFLAFLALVAAAIFYAWWQKFVRNTPHRYGKGPGQDLRGIESAGRTLDRRDDYTRAARH